MEKPFVSRNVGKDQMIYDPQADSVHILNPTARLVLDAHKRGLTPEAIAAELHAAFQPPADRSVLEDVNTCLAALREAGLA